VSSTATLVYYATAVGPVVPAALEAAMAAVDIGEVQIETITGCTLTSDTTTLAGPIATRTIVFDIATAIFQEQFPPGSDQAGPFYGLYTQVLSGALDCPIAEVLPVIA
jgi:hypothetical protein